VRCTCHPQAMTTQTYQDQRDSKGIRDLGSLSSIVPRIPPEGVPSGKAQELSQTIISIVISENKRNIDNYLTPGS
jgi:hypothetical protein